MRIFQWIFLLTLIFFIGLVLSVELTFLQILMFLVICFISPSIATFIHELGHFIVCRAFKYPVKEFILGSNKTKEILSFPVFSTTFSLRKNFLIGGGKVDWDFKSEFINPWHVLIVAFAGPLMSLVLSIGILAIGLIFYFHFKPYWLLMGWPMIWSFIQCIYNIWVREGSDGQHIKNSFKKIKEKNVKVGT